MHKLVLQCAGDEVIAQAGGNIKSLSGEIAITDDGANLIRSGLDDGIALQAKVGDSEEELAVGLDLEKSPDGGDLAKLRIVLENLLNVVTAAGGEADIADDG